MTAETFWTALGTVVATVSLIGWFFRNLKKDIKENFSAIDKRFDKIDERLDKIDGELKEIRKDIGDIKIQVGKLEIRVDERTFRIKHYSTGTEEQGN